ncbi:MULTISPECIES: PLD nuclease N-terminal domain-containing protein [Enterococcus]|uniref:PLDc_N domain-containing protein n=1 Tax=Candidatus Enterococcus murrayae TaxID=2815321 RepID=A0ABS3HBG6_9ENTE|nr:PLD nuclease N-terminal domain-containing protein [Enterococcus sp. MJM16]MBO0450799.1 PLDc_N domain-containing protein [Enterococcus sp. MJM16]
MNNFTFLKDNLPIFLPLIILELILMITAVRHVLTHPQYRFGNKSMWLFVVVLLQIIGPVIYFAFGRGED